MATLALSAGAVIKAGANVAAQTQATWNSYIEQAEAYLCGLVKYDLVGNWATLSGGAVAKLFTEYCERSAAVEGISYDMSGYTSRVEAEDMLNVHIFRMGEIKKVLDEAGVQDFIGV